MAAQREWANEIMTWVFHNKLLYTGANGVEQFTNALLLHLQTFGSSGTLGSSPSTSTGLLLSQVGLCTLSVLLVLISLSLSLSTYSKDFYGIRCCLVFCSSLYISLSLPCSLSPSFLPLLSLFPSTSLPLCFALSFSFLPFLPPLLLALHRPLVMGRMTAFFVPRPPI